MTHPSIVILTGAGISKESGLDTFRDADGIWNKYDLEDVATPEGFARDPDLVHDFYNARRARLPEVAPNAAHVALAELEAERPGEVLLVTQNVDDLHERAGSRNLMHMHGELAKARCGACGNVTPWTDDLSVATACPACAEIGAMRPHVVWFGEMPLYMDDIYAALEACSLFLSIGTSGNVYPAAGFVSQVRSLGRARTVELNLEPSDGATAFAEDRLRTGHPGGAGLRRCPAGGRRMTGRGLAAFLSEARACTLCAEHLPLGPKPIVRAGVSARLLIVGQAPGTKVHEAGIPWHDASGDRLRDWMGIDRDTFYDEFKIAVVPMGLCYPGRAKNGGDNPPRPECAPLWHPRLPEVLPNIELTLLVGAHAQAYYLGGRKHKTMTETVAHWRDFAPDFLPMPHPSWRSTRWLSKNPWFETDVVPVLRDRVADLIA